MSRFRFRLQTVLRLRDAHRDQRRAELADAYRVEETLTADLNRAAEELREARQALAIGPGEVDVDRLLNIQRYELVLRQQMASLHAQLKGVRQEVERRRLALVEADRDVKAMEQLRDRHRERWQAEEERAESNRMDDLALASWLREDDA